LISHIVNIQTAKTKIEFLISTFCSETETLDKIFCSSNQMRICLFAVKARSWAPNYIIVYI